MCPLHFAAYFDPEFKGHLLTTFWPDDVCNDDEGEYEDLGVRKTILNVILMILRASVKIVILMILRTIMKIVMKTT